MIQDITLGQYFPISSVIHRLDPRIKLALTFVLIIFVFVASSAVSTLLVVAAAVKLTWHRQVRKIHPK